MMELSLPVWILPDQMEERLVYEVRSRWRVFCQSIKSVFILLEVMPLVLCLTFNPHTKTTCYCHRFFRSTNLLSFDKLFGLLDWASQLAWWNWCWWRGNSGIKIHAYPSSLHVDLMPCPRYKFCDVILADPLHSMACLLDHGWENGLNLSSLELHESYNGAQSWPKLDPKLDLINTALWAWVRANWVVSPLTGPSSAIHTYFEVKAQLPNAI